MNGKQKMVVVAIDLLLLLQLAFSIYLGQRQPDEMVVVFLKAYIPMVIVTLMIGRLVIKRFGKEEKTPPSNPDGLRGEPEI